MPSRIITNNSLLDLGQQANDMTASNTIPLTEAFVSGWKKLPDELKLYIIGVNQQFNDSLSITSAQQRYIKDQAVLYTHYSPEFGALAQETLYTCNTFKIDTLNIFTYDDRVLLPPAKFRYLIHRLEIEAHVRLPNTTRLLIGFQDNTYGFTNLKHLKVILHFSLRNISKPGTCEFLQRKYRFCTRDGEVKVSREGYEKGEIWTSYHYRRGLDDLQEIVNKNITFGPLEAIHP